jgi:superfamily II DNA or RNA helicase
MLKNASYPEIDDEEFQKKIYEKREFYANRFPERNELIEYKDIQEYREKICGGTFQLTNQQVFLSNFINPNTPYKGVLIFHGTGVGKTCSAIAIAENFKEMVKKYNTKIYIIVPGPLLKEQWKNEIIKCTKNTYLNINEDEYIDDNQRKTLENIAKLNALQYYKIKTDKGFYKQVLGHKIIEKKEVNQKKKYRKTEEGDYERDQSIDKLENLNNTLLIVDEAHRMTGNEYGLALKKIINNSKNLRLVLLTATPMKNLADDIVELINYLRPSDDQMNRDNIFTSDKNYLMNFKPKGVEYLKKMCQGYISHYRGVDPLTFAVQVDKGIIPEQFNYTSIIRCKMEDFQLDGYNSIKKEIEDSLERKSSAVANFVIPIIDNKELVASSGKEGIKKLINLLSTNKKLLLEKIKDKFFKDESDININEIVQETNDKNSITGLIFKQPYLKNFSSKFNKCLENLLELKNGTAFIYSNLVKSGIELFEQVLIQNGCFEYNPDGNYNITDNSLDAITNLTFTEFKNQKIKREFYPTIYIKITGQSEESNDTNVEEKNKILNNIFSQYDNINGNKIKFILGSKVMNEGFTLKYVKQVHILDVHFNLNKVYQTIGRAIRHCVHYELMNESNPYPKVEVFKYTVGLPNSNDLSIEELLYQKAEQKYVLIKKVERALKEISIDCPINYNGNVLPEEVKKYENCNGIKECPATCDFTKCNYLCEDKALNLKYYDRTTQLYKRIDRIDLDYSTFTNELARPEINYIKDIIKKLYRIRYVYTLDQLFDFVKNNYDKNKLDLFDPFFLYKALDELTPVNENDFNNYNDIIYDKYNNQGYLIFRDKFYIYQPFKENEDIVMFYRTTYQEELLHDINIQQFMELNKIVISTKKNKDYKYIIEYYNSKPDFIYVGIIDKDIDNNDVFKIRQGKEKYENKKRGSGIPTLKGAVCYTSKDKIYLKKIAKEIGIKDYEKIKRYDICEIIKQRLLFLEKYSTNKDDNKYTFIIIPSNHKYYKFPFNLEDMVEQLKESINNLLPKNVNFKVDNIKNGIFNNKRNKDYSCYKLSFKYEDFQKEHINKLKEIGLILENNEWSIIVE